MNTIVIKSLFLFSLSFMLFNAVRRYNEGGEGGKLT